MCSSATRPTPGEGAFIKWSNPNANSTFVPEAFQPRSETAEALTVIQQPPPGSRDNLSVLNRSFPNDKCPELLGVAGTS
jgi:hypothetical protein